MNTRRSFIKALAFLTGASAVPASALTASWLKEEAPKPDLLPKPLLNSEEDLLPVIDRPYLTNQMPSTISMLDVVAGCNIPAGRACTLNAEGQAILANYDHVYQQDPVVYGFSVASTQSGKHMTIFHDSRIFYHDSVVVGTRYYLSADTPGRLISKPYPNQKTIAVGFVEGKIIARNNLYSE